MISNNILDVAHCLCQNCAQVYKKDLCRSIILKIKSVNIILITVRTNLGNNESQIYINSNINRCIINNTISSYIHLKHYDE